MFLADYANLVKHPEKRMRKWHEHLHAVELSLPDSVTSDTLVEFLITELTRLSSPVIEVELPRFLKLPLIINNSLLESKLLIFMPQMWHKLFRGEADFNSMIETINEASYYEQTFFFAQLQWELFGLMVQLPTIEDKFFQYHYHFPFLSNLLKVTLCSHAVTSLKNDLIAGFEEVSRLLAKDFATFSRPDETVNFVLQANEL